MQILEEKRRDTSVFREKTTKHGPTGRPRERGPGSWRSQREACSLLPPAQRVEWEDGKEHKAGVEHKEESRREWCAPKRSASEFLKGGSLPQTVVPSPLTHWNSVIVRPRSEFCTE